MVKAVSGRQFTVTLNAVFIRYLINLQGGFVGIFGRSSVVVAVSFPTAFKSLHLEQCQLSR